MNLSILTLPVGQLYSQLIAQSFTAHSTKSQHAWETLERQGVWLSPCTEQTCVLTGWCAMPNTALIIELRTMTGTACLMSSCY